MTELTRVKLVGITDKEGRELERIGSRLLALHAALGVSGTHREADLILRLARRVTHAQTVSDYYDKFEDER